MVKLNLKNNAVSFISCSKFDDHAEPIVGDSVIVHLDGTNRKRSQSKDPEIYHHKWMLVADDYTGFDVIESKTRSQLWIDIPGLDRRKIGRLSYWTTHVLPIIDKNDATLENHLKATNKDPMQEASGGSNSRIARYKTAIKRASFSKPISCLLRDGLLNKDKSFFDYGCGHGQDLELLADLEITGTGWDPTHRPTEKKKEANVVNLGYVINVIEDPAERTQAILSAWELSDRILCVSAQIEFAAPDKELQPYNDGCLTSRGTFQKYYNQHELREYLQEVVGIEAISAAPGIFYLFKCEETRQQFFSTRYQRQYAVPRRKISEVLFEQNKEILEPFMVRLTELGRIPLPEEHSGASELIKTFGSLKRAFKLVQKVTDESPWEEIAQKRTEDLLVYLALSRFGKRPPFSKLPISVQKDIKEFLGGYKAGCARADTLLFRAGDAEAIDLACQRASVGHLVANALVFHKTCLKELEPLLRIYEGCARALVGELDAANVIKLHRYSGKVSYITYADFDKNPHPALVERMKVSLRSMNIDWFDYSDWDDPYLLLEKDKLIPNFHPKKKLFKKLFNEEKKLGLFGDLRSEQIRESMLNELMAIKRFEYRGHKLIKQ